MKTVDDMVVVQGKQIKRKYSISKDDIYKRTHSLQINHSPDEIPRHFEMHFRLPPMFDSEDVYSEISEDGILEIIAEKKKMLHLDEQRSTW